METTETREPASASGLEVISMEDPLGLVGGLLGGCKGVDKTYNERSCVPPGGGGRERRDPHSWSRPLVGNLRDCALKIPLALDNGWGQSQKCNGPRRDHRSQPLQARLWGDTSPNSPSSVGLRIR